MESEKGKPNNKKKRKKCQSGSNISVNVRKMKQILYGLNVTDIDSRRFMVFSL